MTVELAGHVLEGNSHLMPEKIEHTWPLPNEHMFSKWQTKTGLPNSTQYRVCVHPQCRYTEERPTPKG